MKHKKELTIFISVIAIIGVILLIFLIVQNKKISEIRINSMNEVKKYITANLSSYPYSGDSYYTITNIKNVTIKDIYIDTLSTNIFDFTNKTKCNLKGVVSFEGLDYNKDRINITRIFVVDMLYDNEQSYHIMSAVIKGTSDSCDLMVK